SIKNVGIFTGNKKSKKYFMVPEQEKLTLKSLMKVICDSNDELTSHINKTTTDIQTSRTKIELSLSTLAEQIDEMQTRKGANEDNLKDTYKTDDLENRSRRSNIKITNIPEKSEGSDTVGYLESLIPQLLENDNFTSPITLERAHRLGRPSDWTRHIAKFLNYREKDKVLRLAREKGAVYLNDKRISFFPDYSVEIQRKINGFNDVKKNLREKNIEYGGFKLFSTQKILISNTDII
uniref:L1 transposable element RRM domain-containing protein n=1 Tax=Sinocyclocheilus rhinocerous TaxID=307959 RepID=A0A673NI37_9TELE